MGRGEHSSWKMDGCLRGGTTNSEQAQAHGADEFAEGDELLPHLCGDERALGMRLCD
jgi:hypothetical protein